MAPDNRPLIQQINFGPDSVEVVFVERRDMETFEKTGITRTMIVACPKPLVEDQIAELLEDVQDLLDAVEVRQRNPTFR